MQTAGLPSEALPDRVGDPMESFLHEHDLPENRGPVDLSLPRNVPEGVPQGVPEVDDTGLRVEESPNAQPE